MVICEKGLIRAMKEAYKTEGYEIACKDVGDIRQIRLETDTWRVMCSLKNLPRKVLALIVEHLGEIPEPGQAFHVNKKEAQTKITQYNDAFCGIEPDDCINPPDVIKTDVVYRYGNIWRQSQDGEVFWINPDLEEIMLSYYYVKSLGGKALSITGNVSSVSIKPQPPLNAIDERMLEYFTNMPTGEK